MAKERVIVGVDVGTTKICALIGEVDQDNRLNIVGVGMAPSQGLRKGMVVNIDEAAAAIREALDKTERISGYKIGTALVGIAGSHITSQNSRGIVAVSPNMHEITQNDIDRAIEAARAQPLPHNREVLHVIPREYVVDGENGIHDPLGMSGNRLEVETHIVTGAVTSIHNLIKCVEKTGIEIDDMVLEPMASSEAVLTSAERDLGVAMIDIGGGTTDLAIFINGSIWHTAVIGIGGNHLTNDIAVGLRTDPHVAEEMKQKYGTALAERVDVNEMIKMPTFDNTGGRAGLAPLPLRDHRGAGARDVHAGARGDPQRRLPRRAARRRRAHRRLVAAHRHRGPGARRAADAGAHRRPGASDRPGRQHQRPGLLHQRGAALVGPAQRRSSEHGKARRSGPGGGRSILA